MSEFKGMRTEKELWEVVLSRPHLFEHGLCHWVYDTWVVGVLEDEEQSYLQDVLDLNLPPRIHSYPCVTSPIYSFPHGQLQPRIDWINERIKKLESCQF